MVNVEFAGDARRRVAIVDAQLAPRAVAVGVHRGLGHAELAGDLLGRQMLVHKPQAFALTDGEEVDRIVGVVGSCAHSVRSKRHLEAAVYFKAKEPVR